MPFSTENLFWAIYLRPYVSKSVQEMFSWTACADSSLIHKTASSFSCKTKAAFRKLKPIKTCCASNFMIFGVGTQNAWKGGGGFKMGEDNLGGIYVILSDS